MKLFIILPVVCSVVVCSMSVCLAENLCTSARLARAIETIESTSAKYSSCDPQKTNHPNWTLVWSDEFDSGGRPDPKKWEFETGGWGWGNDEDQFYVDHPENTYVKDGQLVIKAIKKEYENRQYTSGKLLSQKSFTYGRFEIRAKLPKGNGTWAAAWLLADKQVYGSQLWPDNGEIDILEMVGHEGGPTNHSSAHTKDYNFQIQKERTGTTTVPNGDNEFHNYVVNWLPDSLEFFVDDKKFLTIKKSPNANWREWPFDQDFHLILNLAIGGFWARQGGIDENLAKPTVEFDYVRVYRPSAEACGDASKKLNAKSSKAKD